MKANKPSLKFTHLIKYNILFCLVLMTLSQKANCGEIESLKLKIDSLSKFDGNYSTLGWLHDDLAKIYFKTGKSDSAVFYMDKGLKYAYKTDDYRLKSDLHYHFGMVYGRMTKYPESLRQYYTKKNLAILNDNVLDVYKSDIKIANIYSIIGDFEKAYEILLECLNRIDEENQVTEKGFVLYQLGSTFYYQGNYEKALDYYSKSKEIFETIDNPTALYSSLGGLGSTYSSLKDFNKALSIHEESLTIAKKIKENYEIANATYNIGNAHFGLKNYEESEIHFKKSKALMEEIGNKTGLCYAIGGLGKLYAATGRADEAKVLLGQAIEMINKNDSKSHLQKIYKLSADALFATGDLEEAYEHLKKHLEFKEEIINEETATKLSNTKARYELQKAEKDAKIALLEKDTEIQRTYNVLGLVSLFMLSLLFTFIFSLYRNHSKNNKILAIKNEEIEFQNNKLISSNQALEQFAYIVSHDLKEPLRSVSCYSSLIESRYHNQLDDLGKESIGFIRSSVKRMYSLLDDILNYSRSIKKVGDHTELVDVNQAVQTVIKNLEYSIEESNAKVKILKPLPQINANQIQIVTLFQNLIGNAIKFRNGKVPEVKISCSEKEEEVIFEVKDNGIGISEEYHDKIFQVFKRLNPKKDFEGSGVGLALCSNIVEQLDGKIWLESKEGNGATFFFSVPKYSLN